jgi:hypothetical protein
MTPSEERLIAESVANPWLDKTRLCEACEAPWRACMHFAVHGLKCCKDCKHPALINGLACGPVGSTAPADPHTTGFDDDRP